MNDDEPPSSSGAASDAAADPSDATSASASADVSGRPLYNRGRDGGGGGRRTHRRGLFAFSALYTALYAGAFLGWGPMKLMLEENGAFASRCGENAAGEEAAEVAYVGGTCAKQTASLLNVQMIAQLTLVCSPLLGEISDRFGAPALMRLLGTAGCLGLALLTSAAALYIDALLYPAFLCLGLMSIASNVVSVPTGMVFRPGRDRSRVISALSALFDAGSATYLALWAIKGATGASLAAVAAGYAVGAVLCFGGGAYFWSIVVPAESANTAECDAGSDAGNKEATEEAKGAPTSRDCAPSTVDAESVEMVATLTVCDAAATTTSALTSDEGHQRASDSLTSTETEDGLDRSTLRRAEGDRFEEGTSLPSHRDTDYVPIAKRPPLRQLRSAQFVMLAAFFAFHVAKNIFTLTTARDFLAFLGDDETGHRYLTIFTLLMPASVVGLPLVDCAIDRRGYRGSLQVINALSLVHGIVQASSANLNVQVLGFVVFSFFRCFLFAVVFSFLPTVLGSNVVGKGVGLLHLSAGVCSFLNIPLANLAVERLGGDFLVPNLFYTALVMPCALIAWRIGEGIEKERAFLSGDVPFG